MDGSSKKARRSQEKRGKKIQDAAVLLTAGSFFCLQLEVFLLTAVCVCVCVWWGAFVAYSSGALLLAIGAFCLQLKLF